LHGGKHLKRSFLFLTLCSFAGAGLATAQNFQLTGTGSNIVLDNVYISPYTATVNGVTNTPVICDDFADEVFINETWTATSGTVGSSTSGLFGPENTQGYGEVAWLSEQLFLNPGSAGAISYAIWSVFDEGDSTTFGVSKTGVEGYLNSYNDSTTFNAVFGTNGWLAQAQAAVPNGAASSNFSNVSVYTPVSGSQSTGGRPQEFLVVNTPEAPSVANLAVDFLGLGAVLFAFRRSKFASR
jgi:hypothetical protein